MVFEKGEDVKSIESFTFDSASNQLQQIRWSQDQTREGYEVRLGYYRQFKSEDALLVVTFVNLDPSYQENFDIQLQVLVRLLRLSS